MQIEEKREIPNSRRLLYSLCILIVLFGYGFYFHSYFISAFLTNKTVPQPQSQSPVQHQKLSQAISIIFKTKTGKELKPFIDELLIQDKIQLTDLPDGHYGESGEGCVVKEERYFYEGFFTLLNNKTSTEEMASALVHEVTHYRMIKERVASRIEPPETVRFFEISAFAVQYQFIIELEELNIIDRREMFTGESRTVSDIMKNAYLYKKALSQKSYNTVFEQLIAFGYPREELNRFISQRSEKECTGYLN